MHPKRKGIRADNKPFMTKTISKPIMQRTRFGNKFAKNPTDQNELMYQKERNYCVHPLRKEKKNILRNQMKRTSSIIRNFGIQLNLSFHIKSNP